MPRVVAIGLDSVDIGLVERLIGEGQLPNLAALRARAARATLRIPTEYRSEAPWTEFGAGRSSESKRYWSTVIFDPETYGCPTIGAAAFVPFYALGAEKTVIALDIPHVRPHADVRGLQVIGWSVHDPEFPRCSVPSGLLRDIETTAGQQRATAVEYSGSWNQPLYIARYAEAVVDGARRRGAARLSGSCSNAARTGTSCSMVFPTRTRPATRCGMAWMTARRSVRPQRRPSRGRAC